MQPPTHEEIEVMTPTISALISIAKWLCGPSVAAWIIIRFVAKNSIKVGEAKQQYIELAEDVEKIKEREKTYITVKDHDYLQNVCTSNLQRIFDKRTHCAMTELRSEMNTLNGNICKIMGALNIQQDTNVLQNHRKDD